jgi:predicted SAM-dependent methyltransferase
MPILWGRPPLKHSNTKAETGGIAMKLNLGCGDVAPPGWINVDNAVGARLRKLPVLGALSRRFLRCNWDRSIFVHDLRRALPWATGSIDCVYSSHSLEHLTRASGERFMREIGRVLKRGGIARFVVPDLKREVDRYLSGKSDARDFLSSVHAVDTRDRSIVTRIYALLSGSGHRCMYDETSLLGLMTASGLTARRRAPFESAIPRIEEIERAPQTENALIAEGVKA